MKVVFLGATKGMGRALARLMATRGDELFLLGRNPGDLEHRATDLQVRGASGEVGCATCDLLEPRGFAAALESAAARLGRFDAVVVTAGLYGTQEALERDRELRDRVLTVNFTNTIAFCEQARVRLVGMGGGVLCVFSSVAGDRVRKPVVLYGAAKAGLSYYLEGVDLRFRADGLRTVLVKPGFVRTGMTNGLKEPPFAADPEDAAVAILKAIDRERPVRMCQPSGAWSCWGCVASRGGSCGAWISSSAVGHGAIGTSRQPSLSVSSRAAKHQMTSRFRLQYSGSAWARCSRLTRAAVTPEPRTATRSSGRPSSKASWSGSPAPVACMSSPAWNTRLWLSPSRRSGCPGRAAPKSAPVRRL